MRWLGWAFALALGICLSFNAGRSDGAMEPYSIFLKGSWAKATSNVPPTTPLNAVMVETWGTPSIMIPTDFPRIRVAFEVAVASVSNDHRVIGTFGGRHSSGAVLVWAFGWGATLVTAANGAVSIGDLLCTSATPGYAQKCDTAPGLFDPEAVGFKARQDLPFGTGSIACTRT